jgi:hypothetical protein
VSCSRRGQDDQGHRGQHHPYRAGSPLRRLASHKHDLTDDRLGAVIEIAKQMLLLTSTWEDKAPQEWVN